LIKGSEGEKKWNSIEKAPCLGGEFSRFHPLEKDQIVCIECDKQLLEEEEETLPATDKDDGTKSTDTCKQCIYIEKYGLDPRIYKQDRGCDRCGFIDPNGCDKCGFTEYDFAHFEVTADCSFDLCNGCYDLGERCFTKCHMCTERLLVPKSEEDVIWNLLGRPDSTTTTTMNERSDALFLEMTKKANEMFGVMHATMDNEAICCDCIEYYEEEERLRKRVMKRKEERRRERLNQKVTRKRSLPIPSNDEKEEGEVDDNPVPSKKQKTTKTTTVMLLSNGIDNTIVVQ